jgi:hypothetical protein
MFECGFLYNIARLSEDRTGKDAELARCFVDLVQANGRLTSLQVAHHSTSDLPSNGTMADSLATTQVK